MTDGAQDMGGVKGFGKHPSRSRAPGVRDDVLGVAGRVEHPQVGALAAQLFRELAPVESWHDDVGDEQAELPTQDAAAQLLSCG